MYIFSPIYLGDVFNEFIQIYNIRLKEKKINIIKEIQTDLNPILAKKYPLTIVSPKSHGFLNS